LYIFLLGFDPMRKPYYEKYGISSDEMLSEFTRNEERQADLF
jgi:hypothetical protein